MLTTLCKPDLVNRNETTGGTTQGVYFSGFLDFVRRHVGEGFVTHLKQLTNAPDTYLPLQYYPVCDLVSMQEEAIPALFPQNTLEEGMNRLGHMSFRLFCQSMLGRVAIPSLERDFEKLGRRIPAYYKLVNHYGHVQVDYASPKCFILRFEEYENYPHFHLGVVEAAIRSFEFECRIALEIFRAEKGGQGRIISDFSIEAVRMDLTPNY